MELFQGEEGAGQGGVKGRGETGGGPGGDEVALFHFRCAEGFGEEFRQGAAQLNGRAFPPEGEAGEGGHGAAEEF